MMNLEHHAQFLTFVAEYSTILESVYLDFYPQSKIQIGTIKYQSESCSVDRSFSLPGKLVRKDRNFNSTNVDKYLCSFYNIFIDILTIIL